MVSAQRTIAAIGNFDGVHLGHQALLRETVRIAEREGAQPGVIVFEPHPRRFFQPDAPPFLLSSPQARDDLLKAHGAEQILKVVFNEMLANTLPSVFIYDMLIDRMGVSGIVAGADFRFGAKRKGDAALLQEIGKSSEFFVEIVDLLKDAPQGEKFGSTAVREAVSEGDMRAAAAMLGRPWAVRGAVVEGQKLGRTLGFPTANMLLGDYLEPRRGVYAVKVSHDGVTYDGVANYGRRPTVGSDAPLLEAHLFGFAGDLYGSTIEVAFIDFIRVEKKFDGLDALKAQVEKDITSSKETLARD